MKPEPPEEENDHNKTPDVHEEDTNHDSGLENNVVPEAPIAPENNFIDVPAGAWFADAVQYVYNNGMMVGTSYNEFSPEALTTRGMIVSVLYRLEGEDAVIGDSIFKDVALNDWYANGVSWAAANGIVSGYGDGTFGPNDPITREQMASILYRYAQYKGYNMNKNANLNQFTDAAAINDWAYTAVRWANTQGLMSGMNNGTIAPQGYATRAQVASMFMRFCENVAK